MSHRERQVDELRRLCHSGALARAVDLAFEHFVAFGIDDDIVARIATAIECTDASAAVRRRFAELCAWSS